MVKQMAQYDIEEWGVEGQNPGQMQLVREERPQGSRMLGR